MRETELPSYTELYYSLWELSCRFADFVNFRVIGCSHDRRYIPMLEIGTGSTGFYCVCGMESRDYPISAIMPQILRIYCQAYESGWTIGHFYQTRNLLTRVRLYIIPFLNPDGYEICRSGYQVIRNPGCRQMLRTEFSHTFDKYDGNARGNQLDKLFLKKPEKELLLENENRALLSIVQEYKGEGLLHVTTQKNAQHAKIRFCKKKIAPVFHRKSRHLVSGLLRSLDEERWSEYLRLGTKFPEGSLEQYYATVTGNPSIQLRLPENTALSAEEISRFPLECLYSILSA